MMMSFVEEGVVVDDVGTEEAENVMVDFYGEVVPGRHIRLSRAEECLFWTISIREECGKGPLRTGINWAGWSGFSCGRT